MKARITVFKTSVGYHAVVSYPDVMKMSQKGEVFHLDCVAAEIGPAEGEDKEAKARRQQANEVLLQQAVKGLQAEALKEARSRKITHVVNLDD